MIRLQKRNMTLYSKQESRGRKSRQMLKSDPPTTALDRWEGRPK